MLILASVFGCADSDPLLEPVRESLAAYEAGTGALLSGRAEVAEEHFDAAIDIDGESATLRLWRAKARAEQGDLSGAIDGATEALGRQPGFLEARYDRACWRSRSGDLEGAAEDLAVALEDPTLDPLFVARDPDLSALRASEFGAVVPRPELPVHAELVEDAVFLGGEVVLKLAVLHPDALRVEHEGADVGVLALRKVVEDRTGDNARTRTELRFAWTVLGAAEVALGPWRVSADGLQGVAEGGVVRALAPAGHSPDLVDSLADDWVLPSALEEGRAGSRLVVFGEPGDRIEWAAERVVTYEIRESGQPVKLAWSGIVAAGEPVTLVRGRQRI